MKKNNKGSAFVMVLVITAIVGILAAIALWVSLVNYQMKITDIKVKNNFYSAESVLDQICVGLQSDVSEAYSQAYDAIMVNYSLMTEEERSSVFATLYKKNLKQILKKGNDEMSYDLTRLIGYVYDGLFVNDATKPHVDIVAYVYNSATDKMESNTEKGTMTVFESNIVLKNIEVTFTDQEGFTSIIQTDISLDIPELEINLVESDLETVAFSLVGNKGITIGDNGSSEISVKGSVYAGNGLNQDVSLDVKSSVTFSDLQYLLSDGTTKVNTSKKLSVAEGSDFWTNNIVVDSSAEAVLQGNTMVADDLTLQGVEPKVYLGSVSGRPSGKYVGFGTSEKDASESSSIILNGKDSLLDMSKVNELLVGGYSYVNTSGMNVKEGEENKNVAMGESITVKGNQIGYLIPPECIFVNPNGESLYHSNPITFQNYEDAVNVSINPNIKEVDTAKISSKLGKAIKDYFPEGKAPEEMYSRYFDQRNELVYYYVNLSENAAASTYFFDYSNHANLDKIHLYLDYYANEIKIGESSSLISTAGSYTQYEDGNSLLRNEPNQNLKQYLSEYKQKYKSLMKTLKTDTLVTEDFEFNNIFDYLIDKDKFKEVLDKNGRDTVEVVYECDNGLKYMAVLTSDDYTYDASKEVNGTKVILIVSSKNVTIKKNFTGTVIANGTIHVDTDAVDKGDSTVMGELLKKEVADETAVFNVFRVGQDFVIGTSNVGNQDESGKIPYSEVITYQNWTMK